MMEAGFVLRLVAYYAGMSMLLFVLYGMDKRAAVAGRRRVREDTLHLVAFAGGWPGALLAREFFRHKTMKQPFVAVLWITVVVNIALLLFLLSPEGSEYVSTLVATYAPFLAGLF